MRDWIATSLADRGHEISLPPVRPRIAADAFADAEVVIFDADVAPDSLHPRPAASALRRSLIDPLLRIAPAAKHARVKRLVVIGSFYTALDRQYPHLDIGGYPMPAVMNELSEFIFSVCAGDLDVAILEIPPILGGSVRNTSLWTRIVAELRSGRVDIAVPLGGTAIVTERQLADALHGAASRVHGLHRLPITGANMEFVHLFGVFAQAMGLQRQFTGTPRLAAAEEAEAKFRDLRTSGFEAGCDPIALDMWCNEYLFIDPAPAMETLGFGSDDLLRAARETLELHV